ncbi:MAG: hypothetical protein HY308_11220 [Gammaproteobacteria bacterium]|nr:hypothetical protein [Gammaproteobacteria bacterium]
METAIERDDREDGFLDVHERGEMEGDLMYYDYLQHFFQQAEKQAFGLGEVTAAGIKSKIQPNADDIHVLQYKDVSFIESALAHKARYIERSLKEDDLTTDARKQLEQDLNLYQDLYTIFNYADIVAHERRELPQIACRLR